MGELVGRVDVDQVPFHFMPPAFASRCVPVEGQDPDLANLESVYAFCYEWVFQKKARGNLLRNRTLILERVREAGTSVKLFLLANMLGWKKSHGDTDFYPKTMTGTAAVYQVKTFAATCQKLYGTFDITSLDQLMGSDVAAQDFEAHMLNSEVTAGAWIVNYKLFHEGVPFRRLYVEKEMALHPYWLAIEPSYYDNVLAQYEGGPESGCSTLLRRHRWNTIQVISKLKRQSCKAIAVFRSRERIMPEAIRRVLSQRGLRAEHFQVENIPVVDTIRFWTRLGIAIQHYECLKFVDDFPSIFDTHFARR
jgi:hypothetical protein